MNTNQAFEILQKAGGSHAARIIIKSRGRFSGFRIGRIARQLRRGVPVAKIINEKWFYGLSFYTNRHTLDPRPDSETLVAAVLAQKPAAPRVLDMGTGTGCLIAAIVKNIPGACGAGIEKSFLAAQVARKNIHDLGLDDRVRILRRSFDSDLKCGLFEIIVSNPPYIARGDMRVDAGAAHDPKMALYAAAGGLAAYETIARRAKNWLAPNGRIYLEIGAAQGAAVRDIFAGQGWDFLESFNDLSGIERVLSFVIANQRSPFTQGEIAVYLPVR